jgi:hypothetical protein
MEGGAQILGGCGSWQFGLLKHLGDNFGDLPGQERGHGVANLLVLFGTGSFEEIVVRERLDAGRLPDGEAAALSGVVVDEVVAVFRYVGCNGCRRVAGELNVKAVVECAIPEGFWHILVQGEQLSRKVFENRRAAMHPRERGGEQVAVEIASHVQAAAVVANSTKMPIKKPFVVGSEAETRRRSDLISCAKIAVNAKQGAAELPALCLGDFMASDPRAVLGGPQGIPPGFSGVGFP